MKKQNCPNKNFNLKIILIKGLDKKFLSYIINKKTCKYQYCL